VYNLTPEDKIIRAKWKLMSSRPFFAYITSYLKFQESNEVPTMCVYESGRCLYNKNWVENLSPDEVISVLAHEAMHVALLQISRRGNRDPLIWNIAEDIVTNYILYKDDFTLPTDCVFDYELGQLSVEEAYDKLKNQSDLIYRYQKCALLPFVSETDLEQINKSEQPLNWREIVIKASVHAKMQGHLPAGLERLVDEASQPKANWQEILARFVSGLIPVDYSWRRYNKKRWVLFEQYFPSIYQEAIEIVVVVDTSASIDNELLSQFLGEVRAIVRSYEGMKGTLIFCDADVQGVHDLNEFDTAVPKGGGGTVAKPAFDWISENAPQARGIIYLTDGYISVPDEAPEIPTVWVLSEHGGERNIGFGEIIYLE